MAAEQEEWVRRTVSVLDSIRHELEVLPPYAEDGSAKALIFLGESLGKLFEAPLAEAALPRLHAAAAAVAGEIVKAMRRLERHPLGAAVRPEEMDQAKNTWDVSLVMAQISNCLLYLLPTSEQLRGQQLRGQRDLAFRLVSAAAAAELEGGTWVCQVRLDYSGNPSLQLDAMVGHFERLLQLLQLLCSLRTEQADVFAVLRSSACSCKAVLASLRGFPWRVLLNESGALGSSQAAATACAISAVLYLLFGPETEGSAPEPTFSQEQAALAGDMQLQALIIEGLEPLLQYFTALEVETFDGMQSAEWIVAAREALAVLCSPCLERGMRRHAQTAPPILDLLSSVADQLMTVPMLDVDGLSIIGLRNVALLTALAAIKNEAVWAHLPPAEAAAAVMRCVRQAVAVTRLRLESGEHPSQEEVLGEAAVVVGFTAVFGQLGYSVDGRSHDACIPAGSPLGVALAARPLEAIATAEACLRLAAQVSEALHLAAGSQSQAQDVVLTLFKFSIHATYVTAAAAVGRLSPAVLASEDTRGALAGLLDSYSKFALWLASSTNVRSTATHAGELRDDLALYCLSDGACSLASICASLARGLWDDVRDDTGQSHADPQSQRRWLGAAIGFFSAMAAMVRLEQRYCTFEWHSLGVNEYSTLILAHAVMRHPEVLRWLLGTPAGRADLLGIYEGFLAALDPDERRFTRMGHVLQLCYADVAPAVTLALARLGIITRLAKWAEENGSLSCTPHALTDPDHQVYLGAVSDDTGPVCACIARLVASACALSKRRELVEEHEEMHPGGVASIGSAEYWAQLQRRVTEPLALALERQAAEEGGNGALQLAVEVEAAEAAAMRACGHAGCTSMAGATEAEQPRGKRCGGCRLVRYCSTACQTAAWPAHKAACQELRRQREAAG